ncbi:methyl-accepting chemotaxis protein [Brevundimonas aurantiaca]|uniref:methyl-accepting chemotaxis protein n=1 Tax=Brevundimonas aurantiaca TaxID=74316 RepID=UPI001D193823|nr:methyl-accepting chemotaxis protein [Brevundimonas aurantiaca]MCC4293881.1 methyl-accepting chemotaxis protein [Brevundimonas aurantiaca]
MKALTIGGRINLLALVTVAGLLVVTALALFRLDAVMRDDIADRTKKSVEIAHSVVAYYQGEEAAGRMSRDQAQTAAKAAVGAMRYGQDDYFWINDMHPTMVMHPMKPALNGKDLSENKDADGVLMFKEFVAVVQKDGEGFVHYQWAKPNQDGASPKISYVKGFAPWGWVIGSGVYTDQIAAAVGKSALALGSMALLVLLAVGAAGWFIGRSVSGPVVALERRMRGLAEGDTASEIPGVARGDEIGKMALALATFRDAAIEKARLAAEALSQRSMSEQERAAREAEKAAEAEADRVTIEALGRGLAAMADGDLTYRIETEFAPKAAQLKTDFNAAIAQLQQALSVVVGNIAGIRSGAGEISQAADDLSRRTEQQAAGLEETAAALDEITATVNKTASGARQASDVVQAAKGDAETSGVIVRDAVQAMQAIEGSSDQISQIIGVIDEIAFQTNLLALNAGVEAARAGEAGRGFAVVASEVRALAQRSAEAAKEIKTLISTSSTQVGSGVKLVGQTGEALQRIVDRVAEIDGLVSEIAASAQEQAIGLAEVNTAVNQMDQVTQQNAAMVEQSTAASHSLAQEAQSLQASVARFKVGSAAQVAAAPARAPAPAPASSAPAKPAHRMVQALKTLGRGGAAPAQQAAPAEDGWEEF